MRERKWIKDFIIKLLVLTIAVGGTIPLAILVSQTIDATFDTSIEHIIDVAIESEEALNVTTEEDKNVWQKITGAVSEAIDYAGKAVNMAKEVLGRFIEAICVIVVTSCVIPLVTVLIFLKVIKYVFSVDFSKKLKTHNLTVGKEGSNLAVTIKDD